jgi:small-conductance mechanosensitive channel
MLETLTNNLPALGWLGVIVVAVQILLIVLAAWTLQRLVRRALRRAGQSYSLPPELVMVSRRASGVLIYTVSVILVLERLGVSGTALWGAFAGFATVGAVAFFAAWSVLSNIFCTILIFTSRPFRLYDHVELLEGGDKPGLKGQVVDINLIYTTLRESDEAGRPAGLLQIPNSLFFQRTVRRWRDGSVSSTALVSASVEDSGRR